MAFPEAWQEVALVTISKYDATTPVVINTASMTEDVEIGEPDYPWESIPNLAGGRIPKQNPQEDGEISLTFYPTNVDIKNNRTISAIDGDTTTITVTTSANHLLIAGDFVHISGTTNYDGSFRVATSDGTTGFTISSTAHNFASETSGTVTVDNSGIAQFFVGGTLDTTQPLTTTTSLSASISRVRDRFRLSIMWTDDTKVETAEQATSNTDSVALRFVAMGCRLVSHKSSFTDKILKVEAKFKYPAVNKVGDTQMFRWESTADGDTTPMTALVAYDDDDSWT